LVALISIFGIPISQAALGNGILLVVILFWAIFQNIKKPSSSSSDLAKGLRDRLNLLDGKGPFSTKGSTSRK
jgi:hypothetical protein